jgi:hypothetical protein
MANLCVHGNEPEGCIRMGNLLTRTACIRYSGKNLHNGVSLCIIFVFTFLELLMCSNVTLKN